jgi:DNA topoisomerase IA
MNKVLFVIEAPGKIAALRLVLDRIGYSGAVIYATKGRLYDLPNASLGLNLDSLESVTMVPLNPDVIAKLKEKIERADSIFVMTDNDHEGDLIASHVQKLVPYYKEASRIVASSITEAAVRKATENPIPFRPEKAKGSLSRRIFDRICGFHFSKNIDAGRISIGRVLSPVLDSIARGNSKTEAVIEKNLKIKDGYLTIKVSIENCDQNKFESLKRVVEGIHITDFKLGKTSQKPLRHSPFTGPEAMVAISKKTGGSIKSVSESLQKLYEKGLISYHRTDSKALSAESVKSIAQVCSQSGELSFDTAKAVCMEDRAGEHAHEGIHVTRHSASINADYDDLSLEDKVYRLIYRNNVSLGKELVLYESEVAVEHEAIALLRSEGCRVEVGFGCIKDALYRNTLPPSDFPGLCPELSLGWSRLPSSSDRVAAVMLELGIGRPSTFAYHCDKISSDYLTSSGEISFRGHQSLQRAIEVAPLVMSPERAIEVERILLSGDSVEQAIYDSFNEIGIREEFMFGKMKDGSRDIIKNISLEF